MSIVPLDSHWRAPKQRAEMFPDGMVFRLAGTHTSAEDQPSVPVTVFSAWRLGLPGGQHEPPGSALEANVPLSNSPFSPVDRSRLLTRGFVLAAQGVLGKPQH